jgi:hypothetical protein
MYTHLSINVFRQHNWDSADSQIANLLYDQSSPVCNIFHIAYIILPLLSLSNLCLFCCTLSSLYTVVCSCQLSRIKPLLSKRSSSLSLPWNIKSLVVMLRLRYVVLFRQKPMLIFWLILLSLAWSRIQCARIGDYRYIHQREQRVRTSLPYLDF